MAGPRVGPGGQFCPQPVSDAEQRLDDQMRKVMSDVNGAPLGNFADREPGTVAIAGTGGLDQGYLHRWQAHPWATRMP